MTPRSRHLLQPEAMTDPVAQERAAIVAWLREQADQTMEKRGSRYAKQQFADLTRAYAILIEQGVHHAK